MKNVKQKSSYQLGWGNRSARWKTPSKLPINPNLEPKGSEPIVQGIARYDCTLTPIWSPGAIRPVPIPISMISATNLHRRPKALTKIIIVKEMDSY